MKHRWVQIVAALAISLVVVLLIVPVFVNADVFRPILEAQLSHGLNRKVSFGRLSFSLLSGSLVTENVSVSDDPVFESAPFLQARSLHVGVKIAPLLFGHHLRVTNFSVDSPAIHLIHAQDGEWNFSSLGQASASHPTSAPQRETIPDLAVDKLRITNGTVSISAITPAGNPIVYTQVKLTAQQFSFVKSFPFELSARLPGDGSLQIKGTAGPVSQRDASDTPFNATVQVKHFDPVAAGAVEPGQGVEMLADIDAQLSSDGTNLTTSGKIHAARLQLVRAGAPAALPVDLEYAISDNLDGRAGEVRDVTLKTGSTAAHVTGRYRLTAQDALLDLHVSAPGLPVDQLEQLLPAVGVRLPTGSALRGGMLTADLTIGGPAKTPAITGTVEVDNSTLTGFDLGSKIQGLKASSGTQGGTTIQTLRTTVNSTPQLTEFTNIYGVVPQIGTANGSGTVTASGALNFHLVAKLNASSGVGAMAGGLLGSSGLLGNVLHASTTNGIPLNIGGTTSNPSIQADLNSILKQQVGGRTGKNSVPQRPNPGALVDKILGKH